MKRLLVLTISLLALSCEGGSGLRYPEGSGNGAETPAADTSIAFLKSLCSDRACTITEDMTIAGTVVANDWLGEFYKSIVVVDATAGIEVSIDSSRIYRDIPVYSKVTIFCNGMALGRVGGKVVLGAPPTGDFPVDAIPELFISRYIRIDARNHKVEPLERTTATIDVNEISSCIRLRGVSIHGDRGNGLWCELSDGEPVTTTRRIADDAGGTLAIRTDGRCLYAEEPLPEGKFTVTGILDYSGGEYYLRIANGEWSEK